MATATDNHRMAKTILLAALVAGTLDLVYVFIVTGGQGIPARVVLQAIAAGILGSQAYAGGPATAVLGALLHFFITTVMATMYFLVALRVPALTRHAVPFGLLYGVFLMAVMHGIVVPLSAFEWNVEFSWLHFLGNVLAHAVLVGLPIALFARMALSKPSVKRPHPDEAGRILLPRRN